MEGPRRGTFGGARSVCYLLPLSLLPLSGETGARWNHRAGLPEASAFLVETIQIVLQLTKSWCWFAQPDSRRRKHRVLESVSNDK